MAPATRANVAGFARFGPIAAVAGVLWATQVAAANEWLAICSKCVSPHVFSKSGIGSANALAQARITPASISEWCASWQPGDANCVRQQSAAEDMMKVYQARADCSAGRITPVDGKTYRLAGVWGNQDVGGGRSRWRDASGRIVGRDNASGGLGISQQWELLCPVAARKPPGQAAIVKRPVPPAGAAKPPPAATARPAAPSGEFAVGQQVLARFGSASVGARITGVHRKPGAPTTYDVTLENGQRLLLPAGVLRAR